MDEPPRSADSSAIKVARAFPSWALATGPNRAPSALRLQAGSGAAVALGLKAGVVAVFVVAMCIVIAAAAFHARVSVALEFG